MSRNQSAFPSPGVVLPHGGQQGAYEGMSLRDYFAAKAMQSMVTAEYASAVGFAAWSEDAYRMADAMLAERAK